jgi:hypothetical protein
MRIAWLSLLRRAARTPEFATREAGTITVAGRELPLVLRRHPGARQLILRTGPDGAVRVTLPRWVPWIEGRRFAERHHAWLEAQVARLAARPPASREWRAGMRIHFRGVEEVLDVDAVTLSARLGTERIAVTDPGADLRPEVEHHLWQLALRELPPRLMALAAAHGLAVRRVQVRDQKSRWGSCSHRGTISLNWRLVQLPPSVSDYLLLHELMHLRQMNHSDRFWREVEQACPGYRDAEAWLRRHGRLLR